ncbi:Glycoprotein-N-acetylgalactosamine 3-beta-galactosyltransferase 1 [Clonorchis sinensis]|uniref:Glycoprotein-N-acetylgalactosamine 3-beta-galactosyltransferase 1 n=1 Tax=Clonorchis sinensis TaxID=79923 RepID=A0A3R7CXF3_CLOSI|nr:Glycoprotein-N-acetylgalactosamine 3-beta-galactosyltransferase 1 [Clonorchis sinensis]
MRRFVEFTRSFKLDKWNYLVKLQDIKLFLMGMCIVLVADLWLEPIRNVSQCTINSAENTKPASSYFGATDLNYARRLASTIHIYCFILTESSQLDSQLHIQNTWVRRCTRYGFVTPTPHRLLRRLNSNHSTLTYKRKSWNTMRITLRSLYASKEPVMYYLKADFDTYIIMENVRYMLELEDPKEPFLLGHIHEPGPYGDKISNSVGYVLSERALELIVTRGLDKKPECGETDRREDEQISLCAEAVGVKVRDSFDFLGKSRFSNVTINDLLGPYPNNTPRWYPEESDYTLPKYDLHKLPASPFLVSFSGIEATMMYVLEYLLYHLRPAGISHNWLNQAATKKP